MSADLCIVALITLVVIPLGMIAIVLWGRINQLERDHD